MIAVLVVWAIAATVLAVVLRRSLQRARRSVHALERQVAHASRNVSQIDHERARLAAAADHLPYGVIVVDDRAKEVFRNRAMQDMPLPRSSVVVVEDAALTLLRGALLGESRRRVLDLFGPPRRVVELRAIAFIDADGGQGALVVVDDITERARLEAARTDFVANIGHELKTPVGALALLAETLVDEEDPAVVDRLSERILSESHRVGRIIDDLLDLARIEAGDVMVREPVPVQLALAESLDRVRMAAEHRAIEIAVSEPSPRLQCIGDRRQIVTAVSNLIENAVKYSESGARVEVSVVTDGRWVDIVVADHGIGIPTRDLDRIFERFYRVDRARSRDTGGTGLGLAIVRHVAQRHDGTVTVRSTEGVGSTFTLRLPATGNPVAVTASQIS